MAREGRHTTEYLPSERELGLSIRPVRRAYIQFSYLLTRPLFAALHHRGVCVVNAHKSLAAAAGTYERFLPKVFPSAHQHRPGTEATNS